MSPHDWGEDRAGATGGVTMKAFNDVTCIKYVPNESMMSNVSGPNFSYKYQISTQPVDYRRVILHLFL